jgi:hypothetical protein
VHQVDAADQARQLVEAQPDKLAGLVGLPQLKLVRHAAM